MDSSEPPVHVAGKRWLRPLEWLGAAVCFLLMMLTTVDVAGRYLFNAPVAGSYHMVMALMGVLIFAGLPLVTATDEHLKAGLLDHLFSAQRRLIQDILVHAVSVVALAGLAWRLWERGESYRRSHAALAQINIPLWLFAYFGAAMAALSAFIVLAHMAERYRTMRDCRP